MSRKATAMHAINLSQGFPDFDGPEEIKNAAIKFIEEGQNQYAPFPGEAKLRQSISSVYTRFYGLEYGEDDEITVLNGATEAIFATIQTLIEKGDEVVVFEPVYDSYVSSVRLAGGEVRPVTLHAPHFKFEEEELAAAFTEKTKLVILNSPHNPTGKVFSKEEMLAVAKCAKEHDCLVLSDEVYEHLIFDGGAHTPFATLEGMKERTITISSAGKTLGLTGWKIGWTCAPPEITDRIRKVHQYIAFSVATPLQLAVAQALDGLENYLPGFKETYQKKRDFFCDGLEEMGYKFARPAGTYFIMLPISQKTNLDDVAFCEKLIMEKKVATIPPSAFYLKSDEGKGFLRICFAKKEATLKAAMANLK